MANLFNLATVYVDLYNSLIDSADEETGEVDVDISKALDKAQGTFEEKAVATATVYRMIAQQSENIANEIKRLEALKKHCDSEADRVKAYITQACEMTGTESIKGTFANITFRTSKQTIIDDADILPAEYVTQKTTYTPNKTAIKKAIEEGKEVQGAHIAVVKNIQIK